MISTVAVEVKPNKTGFVLVGWVVDGPIMVVGRAVLEVLVFASKQTVLCAVGLLALVGAVLYVVATRVGDTC